MKSFGNLLEDAVFHWFVVSFYFENICLLFSVGILSVLGLEAPVSHNLVIDFCHLLYGGCI